MTNPFAKATKKKAKLRMALIGPAGSGKTYTAIAFAAQFGKVAVIDTEHGSASKYADLFEFDTLELTNFDTRAYIDAIKAAVENGYDAVVIDSLSHAWKELLAQKNQLDAKGGNSFVNWGKMTPKQDALIEAILAAPIHVIATMRAKMEHIQEKDEQGRTSVKKIGLAPIQRDDVEFEFDVVGDIDINNTMVISKSRCVELSGKVIPKPGVEVAKTLINWLSTATVEEPTEQPANPFTNAQQQPVSVGNHTPAPSTPAQPEKPATSQPSATAGAAIVLTDDEYANVKAFFEQPIAKAWVEVRRWLMLHVYANNKHHMEKSIEKWAKETNGWKGMTAGEVMTYLAGRHKQEAAS